jgi:hypothetical protein
MAWFIQLNVRSAWGLALLICAISVSFEACAVECVTVVSSYSGTTELACPANYVAVSSSCDGGVGAVIVAKSAPPPPLTDKRVWYLTPNASRATGLHCELPAVVPGAVAMLPLVPPDRKLRGS